MDDILPDFQRFLVSRGLADQKHAPFYARWVSRFIGFSNQHEHAGLEESKRKFLDNLACSSNITDWQKDQAADALKIYFEQFDPSSTVCF